MLGLRVYSFPFIRVGKLSYSILILRFQAKMLEYSRVGLAFMWYVFYFKFRPLKTFTRKTLQLSSEGIVVKRDNSYEKIVPSRCLSSVRTCRGPSTLSPPVNYFEMRRQRKYFDVT